MMANSQRTAYNSRKTRTGSSRCFFALSAMRIFVAVALLSFATTSEVTRSKRAVLLDMKAPSASCISGTITDRNSSTSVVLSGTVKDCEKPRLGKYSCRVQTWRIMKGRSIVGELLQAREETNTAITGEVSYVDVHGLGNRAFCDSQVKEDKTRIFFLNRVEDRFVLAASLLRITLKNLENTEKVVKGEKIEEPAKKVEDPCLFILCGFGAACEASSNGTAVLPACVCPKIACRKSPGSSDVFAPVCGSDGVTYPSECRLKAAQCRSQKRIRIASRRPCAPVQESDPCEDLICGNSAQCVVDHGVAKCQCVACNEAATWPVCGSNQITYRSACDLRRAACTLASDLRIVRNAPCEHCVFYNVSGEVFERACDGFCASDQEGRMQCCDAIRCRPVDDVTICGSDGRKYTSRCALRKHACKTGKDIEEVGVGSCPRGRESTVVRGSTGIVADDICPGNCDEESPEFIAFKENSERIANEDLIRKSKMDMDGRLLANFKIELHKMSAVIVYSATMTWLNLPINAEFIPGEDTLWAFHWLHDPADGVLKNVVRAQDVSLAPYRNPADNFIVEEVCGGMQCSNGASCKMSRDESGGFLHACDCSTIGDSNRLPVTLGCKLSDDDQFFDNKIAVRRASCKTKSFLTFRDVCRDQLSNPCDGLRCGVGSTCVITNGVANCECVSCDEEIHPVCGSNGKTYRNLCDLNRDSCKLGTAVTVDIEGACANPCDEVYCDYGGQCEEVSRASALCVCPSDNCVQVHSPVCGSDHVTYENDCLMMMASCNQKIEIVVLKRGLCDGTEVEQSEGSGHVLDECGCGYGATCDVTTIDDEDRRCNCDTECENTGVAVCGSDGATYSDECELLKAQCEMQETIRVVKRGKCPDHCSKTEFGCCDDGVTPAKGSRQSGCPETCQCNEHGSFSPFCDHTTGQCVCRPGVAGRRCEECMPGFWNFRDVVERKTVGCMGCRCDENGSARDDCDHITGQCSCKAGVTGVKCSSCENGGVLTSDGCKTTSQNAPTASSCAELDCRFGQECVKLTGQVGVYVCRCPRLSSCDDFSGGKVCASNGITYADECQMKVVACREAKLVTTLAPGTCEDHFESLKHAIPTASTGAVSTATATVSSTSNAATPDGIINGDGGMQGSGDKDGTDGDAPPDDEYGDGSGIGSDTIPSTGPDGLVTPDVQTTSLPAATTYSEDGQWEVPQFSGSSFMEFPRMEAFDATTIRMKFKSADGEGLLLYNGQAQGQDFISLAVVGGFVEFRFDTGSGHLSLRSTVTVNDGRWHDVISRRNRREGLLKVDDEQEVIGSRSYSLTTGVNLDTSLFVGGFTEEIEAKVVLQTSVTKGLTGCISSAEVGRNGKVTLRLSSVGDNGPLKTFRIADCATVSPCLPNPCWRSSAKCFVTYRLEEFTHKCACSANYYGDKCQYRGTKKPCASSPCHDSAVCVEDEFSYRCICPDFRNGVQCRNLTSELPLPDVTDSSYMPMFAGDSYIQRPPLAGVSTRLDIEITFYTFHPEGLIFYNAHSNNATGDFVALNLRNGHLEFMFDLGEGPVVIRSSSQVSLNTWHVAKLFRVLRIGDLKVDDGPVAKGKSRNQHSQLDLNEPLYIGSVPEAVSVPPSANITTGLMGAIQKFVVNGVTLPRSLVDEDSMSYHVRAFNGHPCYRLPCMNGGECVPDLDNFWCECSPGFAGRTCNEVFKESRREAPIFRDFQDAVLFDGNVKAKYKNHVTKRATSLKSNHYEFQMKTTAQRGLIFFDGEPSKQGDFIALALNRGFLHLAFNLGSGQANVLSQTPVNDDSWKNIVIERNEHTASLCVDGKAPNNASAPPFSEWLNTHGVLWLGGCKAERMPPKQRGLPKSFYSGFAGCIRRFLVDDNVLRLREDALNRPELSTCPNRSPVKSTPPFLVIEP